MNNHSYLFFNYFIFICFRKLNHPKLVRLYGVCSKLYPIYIVMEYMSNGSLLSYLHSHGKELQPLQLLEICYDVCDAMAFLESCQFIHRDLVSYRTGELEQDRQRQFCLQVQPQLLWLCRPSPKKASQSAGQRHTAGVQIWPRGTKGPCKQADLLCFRAELASLQHCIPCCPHLWVLASGVYAPLGSRDIQL